MSITLKQSLKKITFDQNFDAICPGRGVKEESGRKLVPKNFVISHDNLETSTTGKIPKFRFEGLIFSTNCQFTDPFDGNIIKRESELNIKSLEIQLVRVETFEEKTQATEVQNIQVADGDCVEDIEIPTYMLFPKLYSCASCEHAKFAINFQVNIIVIFHNGY